MRHPLSLERITIKKNGVEIASTKESMTTWKGTPLEFLARFSQHISHHYEHLERFYGRCSPVVRGALDAKKQQAPNSNKDGYDQDDSKNSRSKALKHHGPSVSGWFTKSIPWSVPSVKVR